MKKILAVMLAIAAVLAAFACISANLEIIHVEKFPRQLQEASNAFDSACNSTLYPVICMSTLVSHRHRSRSLVSASSIKDMATISVTAALEEVKKVSDLASSELAVASQHYSLDQTQHTAIEDCMTLLQYSLRQLNESLESLASSGEWKKQRADDVKTWLSASLTDHDTCIEGFERLKNKHPQSLLPDAVRNVSKLVSNSLVIINALPVAANQMNSPPSPSSRRHLLERLRESDLFLMEDGFPTWMTLSDRRLLQAPPTAGQKANAVVAQDGTGNYKTISEAVTAAPGGGHGRYVIYVKAGVYDETVEVSKDNIMLVGDGKGVTVVTASKSGGSLKSTATFAVTGKGFIARDMGFSNTAGPGGGQAIALRVASDQSAFYRCSIKAYQDTLYAHSLRQFYRECDIYGSVDFIFGNAAAVFQSCNIAAIKGRSGVNFVTAQGRTDPNQNTGFSIHNSRVTGAVRTYLGRPWKQYSRTVYMQSNLDGSIDPAGWSEWSGNFALNTLYYGEYMNAGPGAGTSNRVKWPGFHIIQTADEANEFTVAELISGNSWLPATGIVYQAGLNG
uniref:Pectinesterase n=1 Tax=Araucaria cunninghamii TaxID=56994 RepID=A0A0D6R9C8_ARACU